MLFMVEQLDPHATCMSTSSNEVELISSTPRDEGLHGEKMFKHLRYPAYLVSVGQSFFDDLSSSWHIRCLFASLALGQSPVKIIWLPVHRHLETEQSNQGGIKTFGILRSDIAVSKGCLDA